MCTVYPYTYTHSAISMYGTETLLQQNHALTLHLLWKMYRQCDFLFQFFLSSFSFIYSYTRIFFLPFLCSKNVFYFSLQTSNSLQKKFCLNSCVVYTSTCRIILSISICIILNRISVAVSVCVGIKLFNVKLSARNENHSADNANENHKTS